jgi:pimeloyl-ACP methyl ester carboxylesterase
VTGIALLAPHAFVEDVTVAEIRIARERYTEGALRERMARHHDDVDAAFWGWCDVWLDPAFRDWNLEADAERVERPVLLIQGVDDPYGTLEQLDRIQARVRGPVARLEVPGGHSPHLEATDEVIAAITDWLA